MCCPIHFSHVYFFLIFFLWDLSSGLPCKSLCAITFLCIAHAEYESLCTHTQTHTDTHRYVRFIDDRKIDTG